MVLGNLLGGIAGGATVAITIRAIDKFSGTFDRIDKKVFGLGKLIKGFTIGITAMSAALTGIGIASFNLAAEFEQTTIAFTTMLGSGEKAKDFLEELADFAKRTPFTLQGVEKGARQLMAVGFASKDVLPLLKNVGDIASGLGLGQEGLQRIILNLGQVRAQSKLTGRELRDFAVAGIPMYEELAKVLGVTQEEVADLVSAGDVSLDDVLKVFENLSSTGGRFGDLMAQQALTAEGKISNLKDSLSLMGRELGIELLPVVKDFVDTLVNDVLPSIKPLIPVIGQQMAEALKQLISVIVPLIPQIIEMGKNFLITAVDLARDVIPIVLELIPVILDTAGSILKSLVPAIKKLLPIFKDLLTDVILPLIPKIMDLVTTILEDLVPVLLDIATKIIPKVMEVFDEWVPKIEKVIDFLVDLVELLSAVGEFFGLEGSSKGMKIGQSLIPEKIPEGTIHLNPRPTNVINISNINGLSGRDIANSLQGELNNMIVLN